MKCVASKRWSQSTLPLILLLSLVACSQPRVPEQIPSTSPVRIILYFDRQTSDSQQLAESISHACRCKPVFIRPYPGDALIYQLALPADLGFPEFEKQMHQRGSRLGIKIIEQDIALQPQ
jgi:hypothetical protein